MCSCSSRSAWCALFAIASISGLLEFIWLIMHLCVETSRIDGSNTNLTVLLRSTYVPVVHYFFIASIIALYCAVCLRIPALIGPYIMGALALVMAGFVKAVVLVWLMGSEYPAMVIYAKITDNIHPYMAQEMWDKAVTDGYTDDPSAGGTLHGILSFAVFWNLFKFFLYATFATAAISSMNSVSKDTKAKPLAAQQAVPSTHSAQSQSIPTAPSLGTLRSQDSADKKPETPLLGGVKKSEPLKPTAPKRSNVSEQYEPLSLETPEDPPR
uniref:MARVEL domain-containing protein n=1 Tax=Steinernema glaseri TaxID=37863 RepID=A0A1I7Y612_9BILA